jgi:hypothetical protein
MREGSFLQHMPGAKNLEWLNSYARGQNQFFFIHKKRQTLSISEFPSDWPIGNNKKYNLRINFND